MSLFESLNLFGEKNREPGECMVFMGEGESEINDFYPLLSQLTINTSRTAPAVATLVFEGRRDEKGKWLVQDSGVFNDWARIVIKVAFGEKTMEIMRGYVRNTKVTYPSDAGSAKVTIDCQDDSYRLDRTHRDYTWSEDEEKGTSDRQILSQMIPPYGLKLSSKNGSGQSGIKASQKESDIVFLQKRANENGYELIFSAGEVYFGPMQLEAESQPTIMAYAGALTNCLNINVNTDSHQPDAVAVVVPDESGKASTEVVVEPNLHQLGPIHANSKNSGLEDFVWIMKGQAGSDIALLTEKAQNKVNEFDIHKVVATGELDGVLYGSVLRPGLPVGVDGLGEKFNGTYYVDKVSHQFSFQGYRQQFTLLRNAYGDNLPASTAVLDGIMA